MTWIPVLNNALWEYDDSPSDPGKGSAMRPLWLKQTGGIRTHPITGSEVYANVRRSGSTTVLVSTVGITNEDLSELSRFELSKTVATQQY